MIKKMLVILILSLLLITCDSKNYTEEDLLADFKDQYSILNSIIENADFENTSIEIKSDESLLSFSFDVSEDNNEIENFVELLASKINKNLKGYLIESTTGSKREGEEWVSSVTIIGGEYKLTISNTSYVTTFKINKADGNFEKKGVANDVTITIIPIALVFELD